jgi:hypothetical protein
MRHRGALAALVAAIALASTPACDQPAGLTAQEVCSSLCDCIAPLPTDHASCVGQCTAQVGNSAIPDTCLDCVDEPLCTMRAACIDACVPAQAPGGNP